MGETQIYSKRLHGITEKRRILGEVDLIQRELEQQKVKLQQLKRKSLRDRWLMDGLAPSPGAEIENPLSETEDKIKKLEDELESLNLQLLYLENPELKIENMKKLQGSNALVNGDQSQQNSDQKETTPGKRETQKERRVIQEEDVQPNGEDGKQEAERPLPKDEVVGHPIPAPRVIKPAENHTDKDPNQASVDHKLESVDQKNEEHEELESQHDRTENLQPTKEMEDESLGREHVSTDQDVLHPESLEGRLELKEENVERLKNELGHIDLSLNVGDLKVDISQPSHSSEDIRNDLDNQPDMAKETPLDNNDQSESETQRFLVMEKLDEDEPLVSDNLDDKKQDVEGNPVSVSVGQDQIEKIMEPARNQDQSEETSRKCHGEPVDLLIGHNTGQDLESLSIPVDQSLGLLSSDQEQSTLLPDIDPQPSPSLPCEDVVSQVQISQVVVISAPGHVSSDEPALHPSDSQQGPSTDLHHGPSTTEASTPPESQPLLHKPPETEASGPRGTNTAETRDKNPREKKTRCQCCVVM